MWSLAQRGDRGYSAQLAVRSKPLDPQPTVCVQQAFPNAEEHGQADVIDQTKGRGILLGEESIPQLETIGCVPNSVHRISAAPYNASQATHASDMANSREKSRRSHLMPQI